MTPRNTMMRRITALGLAALMLITLAAAVSAHETREVEGEFEFVVGFMNEPAYVNQINGIDLRISRITNDVDTDEEHDDEADDHGSGEPVENAHQTLNATIIYGDETMDVELRPVWGEPGAYTADVLPTETGAYSFQFTGDIDGVEINETFQSGPETFSEINDTDELAFPAGTSGEVAEETDQATAIAIAGVVAGLLGLAVGGAALYKVTNSGEPNPAQRRREERRAQQRQQGAEQE